MSLEMECEQLRDIPMFRDLDNAKLKLVAMSSDRLHFATGDMLFRQGDDSDSVYFMLSGRVKVTRSRKDQEIDLAEVSGGAVLGETGVICGRARSASVIAMEESMVLRTDAHVFKELLQQVPQVAIALARQLADRVDATSERLLAATLDSN
jgi:CRP-like cAMP-binding protein